MDGIKQRREDAWAALKQMHDDLTRQEVPELIAAGGWCAPSSVIYGPSWQPGTYDMGQVSP